MATWVGIEVLDGLTGDQKIIVIGDFSEVYARGLTIGSSPDCTVHLNGPSADGVKAQISALSNHRFLSVLSAPSSSTISPMVGKHQRVDRRPFEIGQYRLQILEVSLSGTVGRLSSRGAAFAEAVTDLIPFGRKAKPALPQLLANLLDSDESVRIASLQALRHLGVELELDAATRDHVLRQISGCAFDADEDVRLAAIPVLTQMEILETLRSCLSDRSMEVRIRAASAVWKLTHAPQEVVSTLIESLESILADDRAAVGSTSARWLASDAASVLASIGPASKPAIPALELAMQQQVGSQEAGEALAAIGFPALPALIRNLRYPGPYTQRDARAALAKLFRRTLRFSS